jgi:hypothetical protein
MVSHVYDRTLNEDMFEAYYQALSDIPVTTLAFAFSVVVRSDPFFPTVERIRSIAGVSSRLLAVEAMAWLFEYLRRHPGGQARPACAREVEGPDGRMRRETYKPAEAAPELPPLLVRAVSILGSGRMGAGWDILRTHPNMTSWADKAADMHPIWMAEKIEARFAAAFEQARLGFSEPATTGKLIDMPRGGR